LTIIVLKEPLKSNRPTVKAHSHRARLRPSTDVHARLRTSTRVARRTRSVWMGLYITVVFRLMLTIY